MLIFYEPYIRFMTMKRIAERHFSQSEILKVIPGLKAKTLQNWNDRQLVSVHDQNPGRQGKRMYNVIDAVKLAIMSRMSDLNIPLVISRSIADAVVEAGLKKRGFIEWDQHIFIRPRQMEKLRAAAESGGIPVSLLTPRNFDARDMRVADYTGAANPSKVGPESAIKERRTKERAAKIGHLEPEIDEEQREALARRGIHAEPVIVFPIGEVVNGTLAQLRALDEAVASEQVQQKTN